MSSSHEATRGYQIDCPDCDWQSQRFEEVEEEIQAKREAELHYVDEHGGCIPDGAPFGNDQCPECLDTKGFNKTNSCSNCGFIPPNVRA